MVEVMRFLERLPDEQKREYELSITEYIVQNNTLEVRETLEKILAGEAGSALDQIAYNAFYCLNVMHRRAKDFRELKELFDLYASRFSKHHVTFDHLKVLFDIESDSLYDYDEILSKTYKDSKFFHDNAGFIHLFADVFVTIYEKGGLDDKKSYLKEWYDDALQAVDVAIKLDPGYAKYYATKARIVLINKEYTEAEAYINLAISYEKSSRSDYALRISTYQYYKMMIQMKKSLDELIKQNEKMISLHEGAIQQESENTPVAYRGDEPYAFVSYAHQDSDEVYPIITTIQKKGARIWYDEGIDLGDEFTEIIAPKIQAANVFILMITPSIMSAGWVRKELAFATKKGKKVICVHVTDTILSPGVELTISSYSEIKKYSMNEQAFYHKLLDTLKNKNVCETGRG